MAQALTASCNPFFWEVGALMFRRDANLLSNYARQFGFGQRTGLIGLTAEREASGQIPAPTSVDAALNNVIGQGDTSTTALQMAQLVAAVANGGTLYQPYMVRQVGGVDGTEVLQTIEPEVMGSLGVSEEALAITIEGMCDVTTDEELGTSYRIFNDAPYSSCGKTGTAQAGDAPNAWYVAFAPADDPQIAIAVVVPRSREGSEVAAPITRRILDRYFGAPAASFPSWWETEYVPVEPPRGVGGIASADG
jgi:penicillin-binding protein 2